MFRERRPCSTAQAVETCLELGIDVSYFSPAGRFLGLLRGLPASGVDARRGQYRLFELPGVRLQLAREVIRAKIHNQRVMLMRNGDVPDRVLSLLASFRDATQSAREMTELLGIEGNAAALYFEQFESMLKQREDWKFDWRGRNRRPPRDPVNALLSLDHRLLSAINRQPPIANSRRNTQTTTEKGDNSCPNTKSLKTCLFGRKPRDFTTRSSICWKSRTCR